MNTIKRIHLPAINTPLPGGFFSGIIAEDGKHYAIVTPMMENKIIGPYGEYGQDITGARSYTDSMANTIAMAEAGSDVAARVLALRIDGIDDWAISARDVGDLQYRSHKPTAQINYCSFRDGENPSSVPPCYPYTPEFPSQSQGVILFAPTWYHTSTQYSSLAAWSHLFTDGLQYGLNKHYEHPVLVVRRMLIID